MKLGRSHSSERIEAHACTYDSDYEPVLWNVSMEIVGFVIDPNWVSMKWAVVRERHIKWSTIICVVYATHQSAGGMLHSMFNPGKDELYDGAYKNLVSSNDHMMTRKSQISKDSRCVGTTSFLMCSNFWQRSIRSGNGLRLGE